MGQLIYGTFWGNYGDEKATSTSEVFGIPLGTRMILPDGRVFYYAFSQGAIGAGQLCMMVAGVANHDGDNAIAAAAAVGAPLVLGLPDTNERYVRLYYDVGGSSPTMTVSASIVKDAQQSTSYPDAT